MTRAQLRLSRAHRVWIYSTTFILVATGIVWLVDKYYRKASDNFSIASSTVGPLALKVHGAAAMVFLILLGTLLLNHMWIGWKANRNRVTGVTMALLNTALIITGYALYYSSADLLRNGASISHTVIGLVLPVALLVHQKRFFRKKSKD